MSVKYAKYWVALNHEGKILGIIGVYSLRTDQPEELWVSWFCVESESRKKGIGLRLLTHVINYAKIKNKEKLKIYTSNMPEEIQAQMLYEKNGFKIFQTILETNGYLKIYREKNLS